MILYKLKQITILRLIGLGERQLQALILKVSITFHNYRYESLKRVCYL